jgi:AraC family transcriptional regulator
LKELKCYFEIYPGGIMKKVIFKIFVLFVFTTLLLFPGEQETGQTPVIKDVDGFLYASMEFKGSYSQMEKEINVFMGEFFKQGLIPNGPFLGVYYNNPMEVKEEELQWEIGFPVMKDANVNAPLNKREFKNLKAMVYLHIGPYENLNKSYDKILKYIEDNGYKAVWPVYDKYLNNPRMVKPAELKTEIIIPIEKK